MVPVASNTSAWSLSKEALDRVLARLDDDRGRADAEYERIRRKLVSFFEYNGCFHAEDAADETINRVAMNLERGKEIYSVDTASYFHGIAKNVLKEWWGQRKKEVPMDDVAEVLGSRDSCAAIEMESERREQDRRRECLDKCLSALSGGRGKLIIEYYQGERNEKIKARKKLAARLRIKPTDLADRALRIRKTLRECVEKCMATDA